MESVVDCFDEEASAQEDGDFRAFDFRILNGNSCPRLVRVVFAEKQELLLFDFQADGLELLRIVTRHALDKLDEHFQFSRVERDVGSGVVGIGDGLPPVGIGPVDLSADESPTSAGELDVLIIGSHLPLAVCIELLPSEEFVIRDDEGFFERERKRIRAVEVLSVSGYNVVCFRIADVDEGAIEDISGGIDTGTFHRFVDGPAKLRRQCDCVGFDARSHWELVGWDVFHLLFA